MNETGTSAFRALAASANYLAQDRPYIQYATKELCRDMIAPKERTWQSLKRLGRYLQEKPMVVHNFYRQGMITQITTWIDTDYAGCPRTRKSTSGGMTCLGKHMVKGWRETQKVIT